MRTLHMPGAGLLGRWVLALATVLLSLAALPLPTQAAAFPLDPAAAPFDLTGDGVVTNADIIEVVLGWTELRERGSACGALPNPSRDVNHDGCIDISDVQLVGSFLGTIVRLGTGRLEGASMPSGSAPVATLLSADAPAGNATLLAAPGSTFTVNSTADSPDATNGDGICATSSGVCTLRAAIVEANLHLGPDTIAFNISGTGVHTINIATTLPTLSDDSGGTTIDGYTQPGSNPNTDPLVSNAAIKIEIRGPASPLINCFEISSADNVIRGLAIYQMRRSIWGTGSGVHDTLITGNFIGTSATGIEWNNGSTQDQAKGIIFNNATTNNQVGTTALADRNIISGNGNDGMSLSGEDVQNNVVVNNIFGLSPDGTRRLRNVNDGLDFNLGSAFNRIGGLGPNEGNVISGNAGDGVEISHDPSTTGNQILGNFFGTWPGGTSADRSVTRNDGFCITLEDSPTNTEVAYNVITNCNDGGVQVYGTKSAGNNIHDNKIGMLADGTPFRGGAYGIKLRYDGSTSIISKNIITSHDIGVYLLDTHTKYNTITRNSIYNNEGLGIDIDPVGVNLNQTFGDGGPNDRLDFPVISSATPTQVTGTACKSCTVEIFVASEGPGRYGEGKTFVGSAVASSTGSFTVPVSGVYSGQYVTATATDSRKDTSEFSLNVLVSGTTYPPTSTGFQAEEYKDGGEGVGYHDTTSGNSGLFYRKDDVDIQTCSDGSPCYSVGDIAAGEWLAYEASFATSANYTFTFRVASPSSGKSFHLELNGSPITGAINVPNTGGSNTWTSVSSPPVAIAAGVYDLRVVANTDGFNLNSFTITSQQQAPPDVTIGDASASEGSPLIFDLTLSSASASTITLDLATQNGSATGGTDFETGSFEVSTNGGGSWSPAGGPNGTQVSFPAGTTALKVRIDTNTDGTTEGTESFTLRVASVVAGTVGSTSDTGIGTITETNSPPTASITAPSSGSSVSGTVTIQVNATDAQDPVGSLSVKVWIDGGAEQTASYNSGSNRYELSWDTTAVNNGGHTIHAKATDSASATTPATDVPVTVNNAAPRIALPGQFQVEDYKAGGEGVGYHDTTPGNNGGVYRNDDVDIQATSDSGGGFNVGWIDSGEFLAYDVTVAKADNYIFTFRVATPYTGRKLHLLLDGAPIGGTLTLPQTGGYQTWADLVSAPIALPAGNHELRVVMDTNNFNLNAVTVATAPPPPTGTRFALPGQIQAEDYKPGGQNVGYFDTTAGNAGGAYKSDDVDIQSTSDTGGGFNVGWIDSGEWLAYDVNVATAGNYVFTFRVATTNTGRKLHLMLDGSPLSGGSVNIPQTGGYQTWVDVSTGPVALPAGDHELRIVMDTGNFNLNYVTVAAAGSASTGTSITLPGLFQAEGYNQGGEGVAYHDTTAGNTGGAYRTDDVDIGACSDGPSCYFVGWMDAGEWLAYDVDVAAKGNYTFTLRVATTNTNRTVRILVDGVDVTGALTVPSTGDWDRWKDLTTGPINLNAGKHQIKILTRTGFFNLNHVSVST